MTPASHRGRRCALSRTPRSAGDVGSEPSSGSPTRPVLSLPLLLAGADHRRGPKLSDPGERLTRCAIWRTPAARGAACPGTSGPGAKRFVAVDVTGMPLAGLARSVPVRGNVGLYTPTEATDAPMVGATST